LEQWEEDVEGAEVWGMLLVILLDVTVVEKLGGMVVDFLHEGFKESVFINRETCWLVELLKDIIDCFKELSYLGVRYSLLQQGRCYDFDTKQVSTVK
jgi:hypothetical protein